MLKSKKATLGLVTYLIFISLLYIYSFKNTIYNITYIPLAIIMFVASIKSYKSYKKHTKLKTYYKILTFSVSSYLICNLIKIFNMNYYSSLVAYIFYLLCSFGLSLAIFYLIWYFSTIRDFSYISLNIFVLGIFISYIAWAIFLKGLIYSPDNLDSDTVSSLISLFNAFLMLLGMLVLFRLDKFTSSVRFLTLGFQICAISELLYYYFILDKIISDGDPFFMILSLTWTTGLFLLSCSAFHITDDKLSDSESNLGFKNSYKKTNMHTSIIILFLLSVALSNHILLTLLFVATLIFRQFGLKFMDTYWDNEKLNRDYIIMNETLLKTLEEVKSKNNELYFLANIDPLTSLPNRRNFMDYLDNLILKNNFSNIFALLFIDLDRFKSINDWYGHDVGDKLLVATAQILKDNLDSSDFVARQGGDEFIVILNNLEDEYDVLEKSNKLVDAFREPILIDDIHINSTISIGASIYPLNSTNRSDLMKFSDIALYSSKKSGKNTARLYNYDMKKEEVRKLELENKLYDSIANDELCIYFQPQINIETEELVGIEALVRWNNPELGFISPSEFISIAEDNGFIIDIGDWVLDNACKKIKYLNETYNRDIKVGVNVSPKQFITSNINYSISNCVNKYDLKPHWLDVEITENCALQNEDKTLEKLLALRKLGVQISIDDFGTGYSSLIYLKRYPIDTLKIALELVCDINTNEENYNIVRAIISMCKDLNLNVIAEGVETKEQLDTLKSLGCKEIQGYYFDKPMSFKELEDKYFKKYIKKKSSN